MCYPKFRRLFHVDAEDCARKEAFDFDE